MRFNNGKYIALTVLAMLLTACGSTPEKSDEQSAQAQLPVDDGATQFTFDLTGPDTNPYFEQEVNAPSAARALFADAVRAMQSQQWPQAESILLQVVSQYPDLSGPYLNLGIVYRHRNQMDKAKEAFAQAATINSMNIDALNQLALINRELGDFKAAETHYLSALSIWPKHADSHRNLGILYDLYMGEFDKALQHFEIYQYLQNEPNRQVAGWIIDLQRRINNLQAGAQP